MTLGLAVADNDAIYLAIESCGSPNKAIIVSDTPKAVLLISGWLDCWYGFPPNGLYNNTGKTITGMAEDLMNRLFASTSKLEGMSAYGLLCGYENGQPICYRIGCERPKYQPSIIPIPSRTPNPGINLLNDIQELGPGPYASDSKNAAKLLIDGWTKPLCALEVSITEQVVRSIQNKDDKLLMPIHHESIRRI